MAFLCIMSITHASTGEKKAGMDPFSPIKPHEELKMKVGQTDMVVGPCAYGVLVTAWASRIPGFGRSLNRLNP
jgi:hypothetical protein